MTARSPVRSALLALAFALAPPAPPAARADLVVLEGTLDPGGVATVRFRADQDSLEDAEYLGVNGAALRRLRAAQVEAQAEMYRAAQRAAGRSADEVDPLYILLDPEGDWAYAHPRARVRVEGAGNPAATVDAPMLVLGLRRSIDPGAGGGTPTPEAVERNLRMRRALAAEFLRRGWEDYDTEAARWVFAEGEPGEFSFAEGADRLSNTAYLATAERVVRYRHGDGAWEDLAGFVDRSLRPLVAAGEEEALGLRILETISHEIGHLIHFAAVGRRGFRGHGELPHLAGNSHSAETLSSPEFAFTEGFAMAHSMVVVGRPAVAPAAAQAARYGAGRAVVEGKIAALEATGETATAEYEHLLGVRRYLDALAARRDAGEPRRTRYDFLRSELAVATVMARLRLDLGREDTWRLLAVLAALEQGASFAPLIEGFVADNPGLRDAVYSSIAATSGGILVTPAQAAATRALDPWWQIDLDRDGRLPAGALDAATAPAADADPRLFPAEPPLLADEPDPLFFREAEGQRPAVATERFHHHPRPGPAGPGIPVRVADDPAAPPTSASFGGIYW